MKALTFSILCFASIVFAFKTIADDQTRSQEQFETAENRAAQTYQTSPKGSLSGQVFVASKGGENFKLGAVQISLFARDAIDHLLAGLRVFADAKIGQLRFDIATATAVEEQAKAAEQQANATAERSLYLYREGFATSSGMAPVNAAREALNRARQAANAARQQIESLLAEEAFYSSGRFYFSHLRYPLETAETDAEGKFVFEVPQTGAFVIAAQAERSVGETKEPYYWLQPVSLEGQQQRVQNLSNSNLTSTTGTSSLIHTEH